MKIGAFSRSVGVSIDTIRYYVSQGLLVPDVSGAQMSFGEREQRDMKIILRMKRLYFSLHEIHEYLDILRMSNMVEAESIVDIKKILSRKLDELDGKIDGLQSAKAEIAELMGQVVLPSDKGTRTGVPLSALSLLACPKCGGSFALTDASLDQRYIYQGRLRCTCGCEMLIEDGIVKTGNTYKGAYDHPDLQRRIYHDINENLATNLQKCSDYIVSGMKGRAVKGQVVLEGHINGYFFLYTNFKSLDTGCQYVLIDKYPEMLAMYKSNIEQLHLNLDILYIADASNKPPLRKHCVDLLISFTGDNEHSLYFRSPYIADMEPYLSPDAHVLGATLEYEPNALSLKRLRQSYPEGTGDGYCRGMTRKAYERLGFRWEEQPIGDMKVIRKEFAYRNHVDGEKMQINCFHACRAPAFLKKK
ncbi:MAG: MerR family DNA-binding protein [Acidaminococcus sp.]|jgi:DNA-binding transcriptional MerR regulator|nr:MerR family DNA-binding protein [Acidaminococcus sp.]MCI2115359.1 MerR family DNA-binding protein [Acidaminococcus sp.]MCI2117415.1 MerR family DNA-binding protein [Acidaminococcus sp.]